MCLPDGLERINVNTQLRLKSPTHLTRASVPLLFFCIFMCIESSARGNLFGNLQLDVLSKSIGEVDGQICGVGYWSIGFVFILLNVKLR